MTRDRIRRRFHRHTPPALCLCLWTTNGRWEQSFAPRCQSSGSTTRQGGRDRPRPTRVYKTNTGRCLGGRPDSPGPQSFGGGGGNRNVDAVSAPARVVRVMLWFHVARHLAGRQLGLL
ncbi:hypothetical protein FJTKL_06457 [Diaporthe vaccinii]|uniref:Secreted protein n=1 Tax=Diaporthe vaccinii TaxID=105482 RepID=A0ABR4EWY3_9PEZI